VFNKILVILAEVVLGFAFCLCFFFFLRQADPLVFDVTFFKVKRENETGKMLKIWYFPCLNNWLAQ